jgi:hypothetical protein
MWWHCVHACMHARASCILHDVSVFSPAMRGMCSRQLLCTASRQVFRTEIISRRLRKADVWPLMASALATVAAISAVSVAASHPAVRTLPRTMCAGWLSV